MRNSKKIRTYCLTRIVIQPPLVSTRKSEFPEMVTWHTCTIIISSEKKNEYFAVLEFPTKYIGINCTQYTLSIQSEVGYSPLYLVGHIFTTKSRFMAFGIVRDWKLMSEGV